MEYIKVLYLGLFKYYVIFFCHILFLPPQLAISCNAYAAPPPRIFMYQTFQNNICTSKFDVWNKTLIIYNILICDLHFSIFHFLLKSTYISWLVTDLRKKTLKFGKWGDNWPLRVKYRGKTANQPPSAENPGHAPVDGPEGRHSWVWLKTKRLVIWQ